MSTRLKRIRVAGFRSLRDVTLELTPVTVLIGPNGSGKSNLLGALRLLGRMGRGLLGQTVADAGGANALLYRGASTLGLDRIRKRCPHFDWWLGRLEELPLAPVWSDITRLAPSAGPAVR